MQDDFLHRLRKDPRPEFAARLRARLRRQSTSPHRPGASSRVRTLITLLLLGGTAFAITFIALRGPPAPVLEWYRQAAGRIAGGSTASSTHAGGSGGVGEGVRSSAASPPSGAALRSGPANPATAAQSVSVVHPAGTAPVVLPGSQQGRIEAVSSWAAYPYAAVLADRVNRGIEVSAVNSGRWLGPLCSSGASGPDLAYTFARVGTVSHRPCPRNASGMPSPVAAVAIGYEAVVLARSPIYGALDLTRRELFLALAKWVPDPSRPGAVGRNPNTVWRQVDAALGPEPIELIGPPLASAAGRSMIELLMQGGCDTYPWIAALKLADPHRYARICRTVRTDGVYVQATVLNASRLLAQPNAVGILAFHSLTGASADDLSVSRLDGVRPTLQSIQSGAYPGSHALYLYINRRRMPANLVFPLLLDGPFPLAYSALISLPWRQRQALVRELLRH